MDKKIEEASEILNKGGIIIFPTDTAFGIGCRIDRADSIEKLFHIRKRPVSQATPVLVDGLEMAETYAKVADDVKEKLIIPYWPGALTVVCESYIKKVPELVRGGGKNVGVRMPNNKTILSLIRSAGVPVLGPSANFHGENTPHDFKELNPDLLRLVDYVLEGVCLYTNPSTVVDVTQNPWKILRQGQVEIKINS